MVDKTKQLNGPYQWQPCASYEDMPTGACEIGDKDANVIAWAKDEETAILMCSILNAAVKRAAAAKASALLDASWRKGARQKT